MSYQLIELKQETGIATITLNRPKEMNSLNLEIIAELCRAIEFCAQDETLRVVVLTGAGKAFSAGDDIKIMAMARAMKPEEIAAAINEKGYPALIRAIRNLPKPVIAAVNGLCYGAAGELALACDYTIASDQASFGQLYINLGLMGNSWLLPRQVGAKKALELIWSGRVIKAAEALELGIADKVVPGEELAGEVGKLAAKLAQGPTLAYGLAKAALYQGLDLDLEEGLSLMTKLQAQLMKSADHQEGVAAFMEKRRPSYTGK